MIAKTYSPSEVEDKWYQYWLSHKFFHSEPDEREAYTIVIPPPNVTGVLHMGHMLNNTIQDVLIRKARMEGKNACWVPGTDHASIATEAKVVAMLKAQGIDKSSLSRESFLAHAWEWKDKYGGIILEQLKKLGCSCDWDRTAFTMDPDYYDAVIDVFMDMYSKGYIYRGARMVNWDPQGRTALSDEEVLYREVNSQLYYVKYRIAGSNDHLTVATTRPETILGDTAVCVNPNDARYQHLKGAKVIVPVAGREVPVIFDEYVDMEFGTGALKVTPAHDVNDYNLGVNHKLATIDVFNDDGTMSQAAGHYIGMDRFAVRKQIAKDLEEQGLLEKTEQIRNSVGFSERTDAVVEPRISTQWWVDMKKFMADYPQVLGSVMDDEIQFWPPKFKNMYRHWMENIKDWCISRQLWWGHRIPAWYDEQGNFVVAKTHEQALETYRKQYGTSVSALRQDDDVMDTWYSSWLWPIAVFNGFKDRNNAELKYYYPTHTLVTAPEIIFFWVARMIMSGYMYEGQKPFSNVYFTGIVRDKQRRKMSKSLGNSPDPLDLIANYGADAVRMGMLLCSPAGNDILFDESQVEQGRNFCNKIWNAYRLVSGWEVSEQAGEEQQRNNRTAINWFRFRLQSATGQINQYYNQYELSTALMSMYKLFWDDFCAEYLEMIKPQQGQPIDRETYIATLEFFSELLKLMHPVMPFITEELWSNIKETAGAYPSSYFTAQKDIASIMFAPYPNGVGQQADHAAVQTDTAMEAIRHILKFRNQQGISFKEELQVYIKPFEHNGKAVYLDLVPTFRKKANVAIAFADQQPENASAFLANKDEVYIQYSQPVNAEEEREKITAEITYLQGFLKSVQAKLGNEKFVANAKPDIVEKEKAKEADALAKLEKLQQVLATIA